MKKTSTVKKDGVYTSALYEQCMERIKTNPKTLFELLTARLSAFPKKDLYGSIKDEKVLYESTEEIFKKIKKMAAFLGQISSNNDFIGIYAVNRTEWCITEYAGYAVNCPNVPLYSTFQAEAIKYVLEETKMRILFASDVKARNLYETVLKGAKKVNLKHLILYDDDQELRNKFMKLGIKVHSFSKILSEPSRIESSETNSKRRRAKPDDIATICYTSGTSGMPKGVVLTHAGFCAHVAGFCVGYDANIYMSKESEIAYISYLPLAHILERIVITVVISIGGKAAFFRGNPKTIQKDYEIIRPNFIAAVPRVMNLFEQKINEEVSKLGWFKKLVFKLCLWYKKRKVAKGQYKSWLVDMLVFNKVRAKFGGNLEYCLCGGASINPEVVKYLQAVLCMGIFQGYGLTEGLAANIVQPTSCTRLDTVGVPFPSCRIILSPTEEYTEEDCGELLLNGPSITKGYYNQPEKTKEAFTEINGEQWLKTGDVFKFKDDRFFCIGRVKEMLKTSYGEYIVPERVESVFLGGPITDIFVTGTKYSDNLIAIVQTEDEEYKSEEKMLRYLKEKGAELCVKRKINKYEVPVAVIVITESLLSLQDGNLITPSFKKRRNRIYKYFEKEIDQKMSK
ncbi:Long_chain_fatty_acid_CoA ligase [Enterospora canceri]|uniref:Long_chain_fatty_acid_CoA ligase n=1 Tax=Enterospora canceri TaxID=1081671 RepID=A0A1Y1S9E5_9MICR|nr:Long_chain_fatty_acid_CoA ligase [Enterospora canceri]